MTLEITSLVKLYTILLLIEGQQYGYDLMKKLTEKLGKNVSPSQVYPFLESLEKEGIIKVTKTAERDKTIYEMTKKGRNFSNRILDRAIDLFEVALESKISACTNCGCKVIDSEFREKNKVYCCRYCAQH